MTPRPTRLASPEGQNGPYGMIGMIGTLRSNRLNQPNQPMRPWCALASLIGVWIAAAPLSALAVDRTVSEAQRGVAQQVASTGVALSELAPNAPESHTVQRGDTLWDIA